MTKRISTSSKLAIAAALTALPAHVYAQEQMQEQPTEQPEDGQVEQTEDEIVVTGFRSANRDAISAKRNATGIIDAISQDEIGLLPDLTIADVARRIPGVNTVSVTGVNGVRSVNAEQNVVIRGLNPNFNLTTFDGVPIASTSENDRAANLSIFPPTVVSRIEAVKTLASDLNPQGLSGQLNLVTASAFGRPDNFFSSRASYGFNSSAREVLSDDELNIRASAIYSTVLGADDQFGIVVSGSYEQFNFTSRDIRPGAPDNSYLFYAPDDPSTPDDDIEASTVDFFADSNGSIAARRQQFYLFDTSRERASGVVKLEYRPSSETEVWLLGGIFYQNEEETRHEHLEAGEDDFRPVGQTTFTGAYPEARVEKGFVFQPEESVTSVVTGNLVHDFSESSALKVTGSYSRSDVDVIRNMSKFRPGVSSDFGYNYDLTSGSPDVDFFDPDLVNDISGDTSTYIRARDQQIEQESLYGSVAYAQNFDRNDYGFGFQIGANYTGRDQAFDREYIEGDVFNTVGCAEADVTDCPLATLDQFAESTVFASPFDPRVNVYLIDDAAFRAAWDLQGNPITNDRSDNSIRDDYVLNEDIYALYAQARFQTERFDLLAGLRYDYTEYSVDLFARDDELDDDPNDAAQYVPLTRASDYDFFLPSVIASYEATDNLLLRAAYGRSIGRPNFGQLARQERIGEPDPVEQSVSISRGNPDLKPLVADNFDLSAEYYFDQGASLFSIAGFYKNVDDLIYTQTVIQDGFELDGQILRASISQPINATSSTIYGVEVGFRKDFTNTLPAPFDKLVLDTNLTWIGSDFTFINAEGVERNPGGWENQPELLANAQLAYEDKRFGAKVAYNYVGEFLSNIVADEGDIYDLFREPRGTWDAQVRFDITPSFRILAEVQNITEADLEFTRHIPELGDFLGARVEKARTIWLGISWTPGR